MEQSASKPLELLIAEDSDDLREIFTAFARNFNANVTAVRDGVEALASYFKRLNEGNPYDAILADLVMPRKDGIISNGDIVVKVVKKFTPQTQVLIMTGFEDGSKYQNSLEAASQAGPDAILQKPISRDNFYYALAMIHHVRNTRNTSPNFRLYPNEYQPAPNPSQS